MRAALAIGIGILLSCCNQSLAAKQDIRGVKTGMTEIEARSAVNLLGGSCIEANSTDKLERHVRCKTGDGNSLLLFFTRNLAPQVVDEIEYFFTFTDAGGTQKYLEESYQLKRIDENYTIYRMASGQKMTVTLVGDLKKGVIRIEDENIFAKNDMGRNSNSPPK